MTAEKDTAVQFVFTFGKVGNSDTIGEHNVSLIEE